MAMNKEPPGGNNAVASLGWTGVDTRVFLPRGLSPVLKVFMSTRCQEAFPLRDIVLLYPPGNGALGRVVLICESDPV